MAAVLPLLGLVELGMHLGQTSNVVPEADWRAAREVVAADLRPDDLVVFAPFWADPLGREAFGPEIATIPREARPDVTRFARAYEVSIRGAHDDELAGWKKVREERRGKVDVALYENPSPSPVLTDLVARMKAGAVQVSRLDGEAETPCVFMRGATQGGSTVVPQGALVPAERWNCSGGFAGVGVLHDLEHRPRLCIFATPLPIRLRFPDVRFGASVQGHSGVQWVTERTPSHERFTVLFSAGGRPIDTHTHKMGVGWVGFELPTPELAGRTGELVVDVAGPANQKICFEATTR